MEPWAVTLNPSEPTLIPRNVSLDGTTWSSEQVREPLSEAEREHGHVYLSLLIRVPGVTGNGLLILFLIFCVKRKPFTVYLLHLAIADFMVLLCSSIFQLVDSLHLHDDTWLSYVLLLMSFGYDTGLHLLTAISVERCLSAPVGRGLRLLWALSVLVSGLENFFCLLAAEPRFPECRYVYAFSWVLTFLVFVPLMIFSNLILSVQVCCHLKSRLRAKLYVIVTATVVLFLVFAMPMKVLFIIVYYSNPSDESVWKFFPYLHLLSTINCSVNPIVYFVVGGLRRKKSRKSLKEALLKDTEGCCIHYQKGLSQQLSVVRTIVDSF
uniref:G-protein coupled receptors family 1 profile domain-containing protein n=1 Tax=Spermophilus dauricus TaxID=99837 RepID=A0A8C9QBT3_SPEDA